MKNKILMLLLLFSSVAYAQFLDIDYNGGNYIYQNGSRYSIVLTESLYKGGNKYQLYFVENLTKIDYLKTRISDVININNYLRDKIDGLNESIHKLGKNKIERQNVYGKVKEENVELHGKLNTTRSVKKDLANKINENVLLTKTQIIGIIILSVVIILVSIYSEFKASTEEEEIKKAEDVFGGV